MKDFEVVTKYYVWKFKDVQGWFGDRGVEVVRRDLKEWAYNGRFLYFTCNKSASEMIKPDDGDDNVMYCAVNSLYYECEDEMEYKDSPFAKKTKKDK